MGSVSSIVYIMGGLALFLYGAQESSRFFKQNLSGSLRKEIKTTINKMSKMSKEEIVEDRYTKFRNMGEYIKIEKI